MTGQNERKAEPSRRAWVVRALLIVVVATLAVTVMWNWQRRLVYFPAGAPPPAERVLPDASAVTLATSDRLSLDAWYLSAGPVGAVVFPGNAGNRAGRAPLARMLAEQGLSVLLVDYRGYGGNPGSPSEDGLIADGLAAAQWLARRHDRVVFFGESIGGAVAVAVALDHAPDALILRSPFTSLVDVAREHFGPVPRRFMRDTFPSLTRIENVSAPVLVIAGTSDDIVPIELSRRLFAAANEPKAFVAVPGAGHNDPTLSVGDAVSDPIGSFLSEHGLRPDGSSEWDR